MSVIENFLAELASGQLQVVDLTQPLDEHTPVIGLPEVFAQSPGLTVERISAYDDAGPMWYWNTLTLGEHTGTHFDAPVHWVTGKDLANNTTDTLDVTKFVAPANVIDMSAEVAKDPNFCLTPEHVHAWEAQHGNITAGSWVLFRTDWSKRTDPEAFINNQADGPHSPGFTPECVRLLAEERDVLGVGVETVGTDAGQAGGFDPPFPAHNIMHGNGKLGLASLTNLDKLPPKGSMLIAAPLKIVNGSGSPLRVLAITPT